MAYILKAVLAIIGVIIVTFVGSLVLPLLALVGAITLLVLAFGPKKYSLDNFFDEPVDKD